MALSLKPPHHLGPITNAITRPSAVVSATIALRAVVARIALTAQLQITGTLALRAPIPRITMVASVDASVKTVIVSPASASVNVGATTQVTAQGFNFGGQPISSTFAWSSSDESIATVSSSTGEVTGVAPGSATITATSNGKSDTCDITVNAALASIALSPDPASAPQGGTAQLTATPLDSNGQTVSGVTIAWSSDDTSVATIDASTGVVTGVAFGTCTVTASAQGVQASVSLTVGFDVRPFLTGGFWFHPATADVVKDATTAKTSRLIDLSGNGNDATQFTAASQPTWENTGFGTRPSILGASGTSLDGPIVDISHGFTAFAFIDAPSNIAIEPNALAIDDSTDNRRLLLTAKSTGSVDVEVNQAKAIWIGRESASGLLTAGTPTLVTVTWDGTASSAGVHIYINGVQNNPFSDNNGAFAGMTAPTIPVTIQPNFLGHLGDTIIAPQALADADRQAIESALLGTTPLYVPPPPAPKFSGDVYVATTGKATAAGTLADPIDQATLLSAGVPAGTTIFARGGTYSDWVMHFGGTEAQPVWVRAYNGEQVIFDGDYQSHGDYVYLRDIVLMNSDTARISTQVSSNPTDISRGQKYPFIVGKFNKLIYPIIHDHGDGVYGAEEAEGLEIYGAILYNNGWEGPTGNPGETKGYGKSLYLQNAGADKLITKSVMFNSFSSNVQMFGTGGATILGYQYRSNVIFSAGGPTIALTNSNHEEVDMVGATGTTRGNVVFDSNHLYQLDAIGSNVVRWNAPGDPAGQPITFTNNRVKGVNAAFNENVGYTVTGNSFTMGAVAANNGVPVVAYRQAVGVLLTDNTWDNNSYAAIIGNNPPFYYKGDGNTRTFTQWQTDTGFDANGNYVNGQLTTPVVTVIPVDQYEPGRAHVVCENPQGAATLDVDPAKLVGVLNIGDAYEIRHTYDIFGAPVVSGTYDGNPITLPQTGYVAPTPIGYGVTPPSTAPYFNVFLVRKTS